MCFRWIQVWGYEVILRRVGIVMEKFWRFGETKIVVCCVTDIMVT